jgi:hypothetical protein
MIIVEVNGFFMVRNFSMFYSRKKKKRFILGDRKHMNEAKKHVHDFYKDLLVTIDDDIPHQSLSIVQ